MAIPIVGMGGVGSGEHAWDLIGAGATVVAVGTESFRDPAAGARIAVELKSLQIARTPSSSVKKAQAQVEVDMNSPDSG